RAVIEHMLGAEYGFLGIVQYARASDRPRDDDEAGERYPSWRTEHGYRAPETVAGGIADIRNALFEIHRRVLRELADVGDDELERPALFWDGAKPVRFRMHRFEAHLVQHAIQVDKTLVAIGCGPTEAHRLIRVYSRCGADGCAVDGRSSRCRPRCAGRSTRAAPTIRSTGRFWSSSTTGTREAGGSSIPTETCSSTCRSPGRGSSDPRRASHGPDGSMRSPPGSRSIARRSSSSLSATAPFAGWRRAYPRARSRFPCRIRAAAASAWTPRARARTSRVMHDREVDDAPIAPPARR